MLKLITRSGHTSTRTSSLRISLNDFHAFYPARLRTLLEEAIGRLIRAWAGCRPLGEYEADGEALNLLKLIIRHVESVVALASRDLVLLPSALVVARAACEVGHRNTAIF
jgi:hypothetical protein